MSILHILLATHRCNSQHDSRKANNGKTHELNNNTNKPQKGTEHDRRLYDSSQAV
jgi:hypothetical protein